MSVFHVERSGWLPWDIYVVPLWDGTTFGPGVGQPPSSSSTEFLPVYGPGTFFPIGFTPDEICELYWMERHDFFRLNITHFEWISSLPITLGELAEMDNQTADSFRVREPAVPPIISPELVLFNDNENQCLRFDEGLTYHVNGDPFTLSVTLRILGQSAYSVPDQSGLPTSNGDFIRAVKDGNGLIYPMLDFDLGIARSVIAQGSDGSAINGHITLLNRNIPMYLIDIDNDPVSLENTTIVGMDA